MASNRTYVAASVIVLVVVAVGTAMVLGPPWENPDHPPGAGEDGVSAVTVEAHHERFATLESYRYTFSGVVATGPALREVTYRLAANETTGRYLAEATVGNATVTSYYADGVRLRRVVSGEGAQYTRTASPASPVRLLDGFNQTIAAVVSEPVEYRETTTVGNGTAALVYASDGVNGSLAGLPDATDVTGRVVVDQSGFFWRVVLEYDASAGDGTERTTTRAAFAAINETTVSEPAWVEKAREETG